MERRNSAKEKKTSDNKMQMQKKDDQHHHHHRRSHDRSRACSWKMGFEKELESKAAEYPLPAIHQNPSFKKLQLESTGSPALCVRSEHPTLECCQKRADGDEKKPDISEEAAAAIRRIDYHIAAHGVLSQTAAKALENPKLTGQTLSQKPFQEAKLKGRIPSQITELNGQPRQMTGHKSGPTESGQMMMSQKRSRAEKMDLPDRMMSQIPKARGEQERVTRTVALESPQLDGKAGPTQDALGHYHASSEMASGDLVKRHVGPQMKIERTFQKSGPHEQDQMLSQTIRPLPSQKSSTTRKAILTDKMLSRTCSKNGEQIVTSGPQVVNHKVVPGLEKDPAHQTRDKMTENHHTKITLGSFQAIESESNGPDQKRTNDHRRNPASEIKNKVKRSMTNLQKPTVNGTMGPTMDKDNANQTRDKVQTHRTKNLVGPLQVSGTNVPDQKLGTRELNRTIETQSKVDGKTVSLKKPVLTGTVGPTKKNLSDDQKPHKMKAVAPRKDEAIPYHGVGQTYKCGPSHPDRMLSWSDDTVSEDSDLSRQMMSRMTLLHQKPSQRVHREQEQKNSVKQGRKVGPILEKHCSSHRGTSEMATQAWDPRRKKLSLPRHTMAKGVPSQTNSELTRGTSTSNTTDTAASRTSLSSSTPSQRTSSSGSQDDDPRDRMLSHRGVGPKVLTKKKSLPRPMLTHHVRQASPRWMLSHHAVSGPPRRVGPTRTDPKKPEKQGGLRRFKDKLAIIFHHHHHHHHHHRHHRGNGDSDDESSTPSDDHHRRSIWKSLGKILHHNRKDGDGELVEKVYGERVVEASAIRAIRRAPRHQNHQHGHLHALLERLLRHVWHSSTKQEKAGADRRLLGESRRHVEVANKKNTKLSWWQTSNRRGGVKLANRKKARVMLGIHGAQNWKR